MDLIFFREVIDGSILAFSLIEGPGACLLC